MKSKSRIRCSRVVDSHDFGLVKRLLARIDRVYVGNRLFLGYCRIHKQYYVDYKHTNGVIRCPMCDKKWLFNRGIRVTSSKY